MTTGVYKSVDGVCRYQLRTIECKEKGAEAIHPLFAAKSPFYKGLFFDAGIAFHPLSNDDARIQNKWRYTRKGNKARGTPDVEYRLAIFELSRFESSEISLLSWDNKWPFVYRKIAGQNGKEEWAQAFSPEEIAPIADLPSNPKDPEQHGIAWVVDGRPPLSTLGGVNYPTLPPWPLK